MQSIWNNNTSFQKNDTLNENIKTDVLIIGGGMCGILCGYMLEQAGVDCVIVEADRLCSGVTNKTTAKITYQHGLIYNKIINEYGTEKARLYYQSQKLALEKMVELASKTDCELEFCNSLVYSKNNRKVIEKEAAALEKIGLSFQVCEKTELPFKIAGAVKVENQAKFHPLKFAYYLAKDLKIYENTKVVNLKSNTVITEKGRITAKKIINASHFPFIDRHGGYFIKMYQHRSYILGLKNAVNIKDIYVDEKMDGLSFRGYEDLLLLGGGGHRTGKNGGNWEELLKFKEKYYPNAEVISKWATQDCITLDSIPYIGKYSKSTPDLYVATGFNKWGMTSSMVSAIVLTDMICDRKNEYEELYSPKRSIIHPQLAVNVFESAKGLITPTNPRCPHLGCALKYNKQEHSWDCPCHGSRFDENGKLINNPSVKNMP